MNINLFCPINSLGYGCVGLNCLSALSEENSVALWPIGNVEAPPEANEAIAAALRRSRFFDVEAPCLRIMPANLMAEGIGRGKRWGFPIFELDTFTDVEKHQLASLDGILVCSEWAARVVRNNLGESRLPIGVAMLGVDTNIFYDKGQPPAGDRTVFLNIGKFEYRKGHDVLIECFNQAFRKDDAVELWLCGDNPFMDEGMRQRWLEFMKAQPLADRMILFSRQPSQHHIAELMNRAHCGVFPARAEGWNLELMEMLACGRHVIATDYSGHTAFVNQENSRLIEIDQLEVANDGGAFFTGQGRWGHLGDAQRKAIIDEMRRVHEERIDGRLKTNTAGIQTARRFTWSSTARAIVHAISSSAA